MIGTELAFEPPPDFTDIDPGVVALGIHLFGSRSEEEVDPGLFCELDVALLVAG